MNAPAASIPADVPASPQLQRKRRVIGLAAVALLAGAGATAYLEFGSSRWVTTDNAYVGADVAQVTPLVAGTVTAVLVDDAQPVSTGQLLVKLDPADAQLAVRSALAEVDTAGRSVREERTTDSTLLAEIAQRQAEAAQARDELQRRLPLAAQGWVSSETLQQYRDAAAGADAALRAAQAQLAANRQVADGGAVDAHPSVRHAEASLAQADLDLERTAIRAPVDGLVAHRNVQVGERVAPGQPLMTVVPLERMYVDANFKETQLRGVHVGQPALLTSDYYGDSVVFHGRVTGIGGGTGEAFALIPAENATGNWIKVVQRLPVRIALDPAELRDHPLRIGLSMDARIDTAPPAGR